MKKIIVLVLLAMGFALPVWAEENTRVLGEAPAVAMGNSYQDTESAGSYVWAEAQDETPGAAPAGEGQSSGIIVTPVS